MEESRFNDIIWSSAPPLLQTLRMVPKEINPETGNTYYTDRYIQLLFHPYLSINRHIIPMIHNGYKTPYMAFLDFWMHGIRVVPNILNIGFVGDALVSYGINAPAGMVFIPGTKLVSQDMLNHLLESGQGFPIFNPEEVDEKTLLLHYPDRKDSGEIRQIVALNEKAKFLRYDSNGEPIRWNSPTSFLPAYDDYYMPGSQAYTGNFRGVKEKELRADGTWMTWWQST